MFLLSYHLSCLPHIVPYHNLSCHICLGLLFQPRADWEEKMVQERALFSSTEMGKRSYRLFYCSCDKRAGRPCPEQGSEPAASVFCRVGKPWLPYSSVLPTVEGAKEATLLMMAMASEIGHRLPLTCGQGTTQVTPQVINHWHFPLGP